MSLLRLTARLSLNNSGFVSGMRASTRVASAGGNMMGRAFARAFGLYFSVTAIRRMLTALFRFAREFENNRAEAERLGVAIDEGLVKNAQLAEITMRQMGMELKMIGMNILPPIVAAFRAIFEYVMKTGIGLKNLAKADPFRGYNEDLDASKGRKISPHELGQMLGRSIGKAAERTMFDTLAEIEAFDLRMKKWDEMRESAYAKERWMDWERLNKDKDKAKTKTTVNEAVAAITTDSLAKIGGFTGRAEMEGLSLARRQVRHLEKIDSNTEALKGPFR